MGNFAVGERKMLCKTLLARGSISSLQVHTGERSFKCPKCDKAFSLEFNMREHMRAMHKEM